MVGKELTYLDIDDKATVEWKREEGRDMRGVKGLRY